jgi:(R)-2-hydroxyacyl-CoA dehydratese activating ATPase
MPFRTAGIDIGSRTVKLVILEDGEISGIRKSENSFNTLEICEKLLNGFLYDEITSTGYGRHLFNEHFPSEVITEIKAFSMGVKALFPACTTILDIGGQDTKAISLDEKGMIRKFEMNDKCAAGTGRFLEIMAMALRYRLDEFGDQALSTPEGEHINNMCTVFAESEVVSMLARGGDRMRIARGIHESVVNRSVSLLKRVGISDDVVLVGGVAYNKAIHRLLEKSIGRHVLIPDDPQAVGALGAALYSYRKKSVL